jgi:hypothetical protein
MDITGILSEHTALIVDIGVGLLFLVFGLLAANRGLYKTIIGVVVLVLALTIGIIGANVLTDPVVERVWPQVETRIEQRLDDTERLSGLAAGFETLGEVLGEGVEKLLSITGNRDNAKSAAREYSANSLLSGLKEKLMGLVDLSFRKLMHAILFLLCSLIGFILLQPVSALLGKLTEAPVIRTLDWLGGFAIGLLECLVIAYIVTKVCSLRGIAFFEDLAPGTTLLSWLLSL